MTIEYALQEYIGRQFKDEAQMERALRKDSNWGTPRTITVIEPDEVWPRSRLAHREEAEAELKQTNEYYNRVGRRFRLVQREISDWVPVEDADLMTELEAPFTVQCSDCGRKSTVAEEGSMCNMSQPFGNVCGGMFEKL